MDVKTTRFGTIPIQESDLLHFERGLIGLESCCRWILLADRENPSLGWLQSVDRSEVAVGFVSPRLFVPDFQLRMVDSELSNLRTTLPKNDSHAAGALQDVQVVVIVSRQLEGLSINLKAPLVIDVQARRGCQVVSRDDYPVRHLLVAAVDQDLSHSMRKIA